MCVGVWNISVTAILYFYFTIRNFDEADAFDVDKKTGSLYAKMQVCT